VLFKTKKQQVEENTMIGFKAYLFDGKRTASKALDTLEENCVDDPWVDNVAVVSRSKHGSLQVHSTWAQDGDTVAGLGWGAVTGGFIGALLGPGGALAGAAIGGSWGGLMGASIDCAFDDPKLDAFAADLVKDSSALVMVADDATLAEFTLAMEPIGGKIIDTELNEGDVKAIRKSLKL
jgi:uncharacterized membrane protein